MTKVPRRGTRDLHRVPVGTEITTKELMLYDIGFAIESIAEQAWYKTQDGNKRRTFDFINLESLEGVKEDEVLAKKGKMSENTVANVTLATVFSDI